MKLMSVGLGASVFILGLFIALVVVVNSTNSRKVAYFNEKETVTEFIRQLALKTKPGDEKKSISKFRQALKSSLFEYQNKHHGIILKSEVVLAGGEDITNPIQLLIAKKMREQQ